MRQRVILLVIFTMILIPHLGIAFRCGTPDLTPMVNLQMDEEMLHAATAPALLLPIGTERTFFAPDFRSMQPYTVMSVLRAVGKYCYVFVEESEWETRVTPSIVTDIVRVFDDATATQPRGIYPILTDVFGAPPDIDANGRIILLLLNIRDASENGSTYTAGFFNPADQQRGVLRHPGARGLAIRSNVADMLYIDTNPLPINTPHVHNVIAHELQHLIHWRHDRREAIWVDEGCADYASFLCGYFSHEHIAAFEKTPNISLTSWPTNTNTSLAHYGAAFLWMLYLHEHYGGTETVASIVHHPGTSVDGIADVLRARGFLNGTQTRLPWRGTWKVQLGENKITTLADIFVDWKLANFLSGYTVIGPLTLSLTQMHRDYPYQGKGAALPSAADFLQFEFPNPGETLTLRFAGRSSAANQWAVHLIEYHPGADIHIREMPLANTQSGTLSVSPAATYAILIPSLQGSDSTEKSIPYEYSATRGGNITFTTAVLPNPVHPHYWDIVAQPSERFIGLIPTITLYYLHRQTGVEQIPMRLIPHRTQYRYTVRLEPTQAPTDVTWQLFLDARLVEEGTLSDIPK